MIVIKKYNSNLRKVWDSFVKKSSNGTMFQTQKFLTYHIDRQFINHSLMFLLKNKIIALFPACEIVNKQRHILYSHGGASYGGFVFKQDLSYDIMNEVVLAFDKYCVSNHFNSTVLIPSPNIYSDNHNASFNYCLRWNNFKEVETYISHVANIGFSKTIEQLLNKRKKRYIKKLEEAQTFIIKESNSFGAFYPVLLESKKNYNIKPTHTLDELLLIKHLFKKDIILLLSFDNDVVVGGSLIFVINNNVGLVFYNVVLNKYKNSQLASYQFYKSMQLCKKRGLQYIDFGVSHIPQDKNPLTPKLSLISFKEQFGAFGVMRHVYKKDYQIEK